MRKVLLLFIVTAAALLVAKAGIAEPRDSVGRLFPVYDNGGLPDLTVDPQRYIAQMGIVDRVFEAGSCEFSEGTVGAAGIRRILRFDVVLINGGQTITLPPPPPSPDEDNDPMYEWGECHGHWHIAGFADYRLLNLDGTTAAEGHKQAFCFISSFKYTNDYNGQDKPNFTCNNQGIQSGYGDWYYKQLSGQWIDITGVPEGDYIVQVTINAVGMFDEGANAAPHPPSGVDYPNVIKARIHVPDPRNKVATDTTTLSYNG
jgi:Lysyl oxidase